MPSKLDFYAQMADHTAKQITGSFGEWTAFLETAARLYKYPFHEQMMIYAQRPDATACAEYDLWNNQMRRYVRRGSKGIALIDTRGENPRLRYVFDVSDTGAGKIPAAFTFGHTVTITGRPYPMLWSSDSASPAKTALPTNWSRLPTVLSANTGTTTAGTSSASLKILFLRSMMTSM